jgi:hypothetical protein
MICARRQARSSNFAAAPSRRYRSIDLRDDARQPITVSDRSDARSPADWCTDGETFGDPGQSAELVI